MKLLIMLIHNQGDIARDERDGPKHFSSEAQSTHVTRHG